MKKDLDLKSLQVKIMVLDREIKKEGTQTKVINEKVTESYMLPETIPDDHVIRTTKLDKNGLEREETHEILYLTEEEYEKYLKNKH